MSKPLFRGLLITAFFSAVGVILIPIYVPRPAFIPGFAPPPDMWPKTISIMGGLMGVLAIAQGLSGKKDLDAPLVKTDGATTKTMLLRAVAFVCVLVAFLLLVPAIGFVGSAMFLTGASVFLTGERHHIYWALAISIVGPAILVVFFQKALGTQFPLGSLTSTFGF